MVFKEEKDDSDPAISKVKISRQTHVKPVHKSGDKLQVTNYRPISILPAISKVFEKVIAQQLVENLDSIAALNPFQFGFRKRHPTETACCYLIEDIKSSLDGGGVVGLDFLDLRKAFNTVTHELLLSKLKLFSLNRNTQNWIKSYLSDRQQCVRVNNVTSPLKACTMGVPQGSILGPLPLINELPSVCNANIIMYADDTVLCTHGKTAEEVV